jgi:small-conductance mechanosensitive channel
VTGNVSTGEFVILQKSRPEKIELKGETLSLVVTLTLPADTDVEKAKKIMTGLKNMVNGIVNFIHITHGVVLSVDETQSGLKGRVVTITLRSSEIRLEDLQGVAQKIPMHPGMQLTIVSPNETQPLWAMAA